MGDVLHRPYPLAGGWKATAKGFVMVTRIARPRRGPESSGVR